MRQVLLPGDLFLSTRWLWSSAPRKNLRGRTCSLGGGVFLLAAAFGARRGGCQDGQSGLPAGLCRGCPVPAVHTWCLHTKLSGSFPSSPLSARGAPLLQGPTCSRPRTWPRVSATAAHWAGGTGSEHTHVLYPNNDLYFQFSKRLCFHLKRCCLLLFDLKKVKDNRIQMKYISILILHKGLALGLPGAATGVDPARNQVVTSLSHFHSAFTGFRAAAGCSPPGTEPAGVGRGARLPLRG